MTTLLATMRGPLFDDIRVRICDAGLRAHEWVYTSPEFMAVGLPEWQRKKMANASALAACELQRIVEIFHAEKAGGVFIRSAK